MTTNNKQLITLYALAKIAGMIPQSLYQLAKLGYIKVEEHTCNECGHTTKGVTEEVKNEYLQKRAAKAAAKAERV